MLSVALFALVVWLHEVSHAVIYVLLTGEVAVPLPIRTIPLGFLRGGHAPVPGLGDAVGYKMAGVVFEICLAIIVMVVLVIRGRTGGAGYRVTLALAAALGVVLMPLRMFETVEMVFRGTRAGGDLSDIWLRANLSNTLLPFAQLLWAVILLPAGWLWCRGMRVKDRRPVVAITGIALSLAGWSVFALMAVATGWLERVL